MEDNDGSHLGMFTLLKGAKKADQAHEFCNRRGLSTGYRNAILAESYKVAK